MLSNQSTLLGYVDSVKGSVITVRLIDEVPSLVMVSGQSYKVGQIGTFLQIPLGYNKLYAVCTLVGAAAAPNVSSMTIENGRRWLSITLFGESVGGYFERGVSQYPTIDDEVHLVTNDDIRSIYSFDSTENSMSVGSIASSSGIPGKLDLQKFITRHSAIVGSTGSGKSNLVSVLLDSIASQKLPSSRVFLIDPHGEYASSNLDNRIIYKVNADKKKNEKELYIPFWALPFDELKKIAFGDLQPTVETIIRDEIVNLKNDTIKNMNLNIDSMSITADSPIPFSIRKLWFILDDFERRTFNKNSGIDLCELEVEGNPEKLISNIYPKPSLGSKAPFKNPGIRRITRQLSLLKSRLLDSRYSFLFSPGPDYTPDLNGVTRKDLDDLLISWVGHGKFASILDVSGLPSEILVVLVGTILRAIYDTLFWASGLPISGKKQPLLIVIEEAHLFLPEGANSSTYRIVSKIAKEGRKYGIGLSIVTQSPCDIDHAILGQCGTIIALRTTNSKDRAKVEAAMPDDLGMLSGMLPSLRTGEGLLIGEAVPIPSRVRFNKAAKRPHGDDPQIIESWSCPIPDSSDYKEAIKCWRQRNNHPNDLEKDDD